MRLQRHLTVQETADCQVVTMCVPGVPPALAEEVRKALEAVFLRSPSDDYAVDLSAVAESSEEFALAMRSLSEMVRSSRGRVMWCCMGEHLRATLHATGPTTEVWMADTVSTASMFLPTARMPVELLVAERAQDKSRTYSSSSSNCRARIPTMRSNQQCLQ